MRMHASSYESYNMITSCYLSFSFSILKPVMFMSTRCDAITNCEKREKERERARWPGLSGVRSVLASLSSHCHSIQTYHVCFQAKYYYYETK